jgi:hypothetical protein
MSVSAMSNRGQETSGACSTLVCDPDAAEPSSAATTTAAHFGFARSEPCAHFNFPSN